MPKIFLNYNYYNSKKGKNLNIQHHGIEFGN